MLNSSSAPSLGSSSAIQYPRNPPAKNPTLSEKRSLLESKRKSSPDNRPSRERRAALHRSLRAVRRKVPPFPLRPDFRRRQQRRIRIRKGKANSCAKAEVGVTPASARMPCQWWRLRTSASCPRPRNRRRVSPIVSGDRRSAWLRGHEARTRRSNRSGPRCRSKWRGITTDGGSILRSRSCSGCVESP
jgi:hypothetical protein